MPDTSRAELMYLVERQREEIKTILEVQRRLGSTTDPQEMVLRVALYLKDAFPIALCGVLLLEQKRIQLIQFAKVAQVAVAGAVKGLIADAGKHLEQELAESDFTQDLEDQVDSGNQLALPFLETLRAEYHPEISPLTEKN